MKAVKETMFGIKKLLGGSLLAGSLLVGGCVASDEAPVLESQAVSAVQLPDHTFILDWNQTAVATLATVTPALPSFSAARFMAMIQLAVFEGVNACTGKFEPYFGVTAAPGSDSRAAAITAAHDMLVAIVPGQAATLDAKRDAALATLPDGAAKTNGIAAGQAAAQATLAARANDGSTPAQFFVPPNTDPGMWQKTPSCPAGGGVFKHWSNVTPFGVASHTQFRADPPPEMTSNKWAKGYNEVQAIGEIGSTLRPQDRADVARIIAAQPGHLIYNSLARQLAAEQPRNIAKTARIFALLNMSLSDSLSTVMETKYFYNLWRPETAIPRGNEDDNAKTVAGPFTPYVVTPCFPSYPSAHGILAGAGIKVLTRFYGDGGHDLTNSQPSVAPGVVLHYTHLQDVTKDVSDARVYGGIHYRFEQDVAEKQGKQLATYIMDNNIGPDDD